MRTPAKKHGPQNTWRLASHFTSNQTTTKISAIIGAIPVGTLTTPENPAIKSSSEA
jgi:hypothetical protein